MRLGFLLFFCLLITPCTQAAIEVIDDNGDRLKLANVAQRIISLSPNTTEILFHIGAGKKLSVRMNIVITHQRLTISSE